MPATACQRQAKICQYSIGGPEGRFAGMARSHKNQLFTKTSYSQKPAIHKNQLFTKTSYSQNPACQKDRFSTKINKPDIRPKPLPHHRLPQQPQAVDGQQPHHNAEKQLAVDFTAEPAANLHPQPGQRQ